MDEEQPQKKITLNNFFEQIVEVNKVANAALTNSNNLRSQLNAVQLDLKRLVESLQVNFDSGVQNVQTQINEVTNVIVDDQRIKQSETDALEQQIFAQEDKLQKQTKGQKAKPASEFGNVQKQNITEKARGSLLGGLALGLGGLSVLGLSGLSAPKKESDYEKNRKRNRTKVKSDGNFFTNFFKRNDSKEDNKEKVIENKNKEVVKNIEKKITPTNITNNIVNNNVVKEIIEEKKPDLVASTNNVPDDFDIEEHVKNITVTSDTDDEEYVPFKYEHPYDPENYQKSIEDMTARIVADGEKSEAEARKFATEFVMKEVDRRKKFLVEGKNYHPLFKPPGSDKPRPTMETVNKAYELGVSVDTVKDGGTTIIDGGTEVVNENVNTAQRRGEVKVEQPTVKSSLSSVSVINIAENNSVSNLSIS